MNVVQRTIDLPELPYLNMEEVTRNIFEYALRNVAEPTIKGEITKGKIRWRGIRLVIKNDF